VREQDLRPLAAALGAGVAVFGGVSALAPGPFARLFGLSAPDLTTISMIQSIGARDVVMGIGLWSAAVHGGNFLPWLLARALVDAGDTVSVGTAIARGERTPRFLALGVLALFAAVTEAALYTSLRLARRS
jgi:hypothetical protein